MTEKNKPQHRNGFHTNEQIVYPAHGVGRIVSIEETEFAEAKHEFFVINFEKAKMTLRVPTEKSEQIGMRKLSQDSVVRKALTTLKGKVRAKPPTRWDQRAPEYEAKIKFGSLVSIAEVVRDLYRSEPRSEQPYSQRLLYEAALDRMSCEVAAAQKLDEDSAIAKIEEILLSKTVRSAQAAA